MKKAGVLAIIIILIVLAIVLFFIIKPKSSLENDTTSSIETSSPQENIIEITGDGFSLQTLEIKQGESVTWINKDSAEHWPASNTHPTHTVYPETGGCIGSKFDACEGLAQNEQWSFTFNEVGEWGYHDHLNPSVKGKIIVS